MQFSVYAAINNSPVVMIHGADGLPRVNKHNSEAGFLLIDVSGGTGGSGNYTLYSLTEHDS